MAAAATAAFAFRSDFICCMFLRQMYVVRSAYRWSSPGQKTARIWSELRANSEVLCENCKKAWIARENVVNLEEARGALFFKGWGPQHALALPEHRGAEFRCGLLREMPPTGEVQGVGARARGFPGSGVLEEACPWVRGRERAHRGGRPRPRRARREQDRAGLHRRRVG